MSARQNSIPYRIVSFRMRAALTLLEDRGCARNHDERISSVVWRRSQPRSWARRRTLWTPADRRRRQRTSCGQSASPSAAATSLIAARSPALADAGRPTSHDARRDAGGVSEKTDSSDTYSEYTVCFSAARSCAKSMKYADIAVRSLTCHAATGTHMPCRITQY